MRMIIRFDHQNSVFHNESGQSLVYATAIRERETCKEMFEAGWIPYQDHWYQTRSARLKLCPLPQRKKDLLAKVDIQICNTLPDIELPKDLHAYSSTHTDFLIDNIQWGRVNYYDDCILFSLMNSTRSEKSYGKLAYYYLIDKFAHSHEHLYITDYLLPEFAYKANLPGFEYWTGSAWLSHVRSEEVRVLQARR